MAELQGLSEVVLHAGEIAKMGILTEKMSQAINDAIQPALQPMGDSVTRAAAQAINPSPPGKNYFGFDVPNPNPASKTLTPIPVRPSQRLKQRTLKDPEKKD